MKRIILFLASLILILLLLWYITPAPLPEKETAESIANYPDLDFTNADYSIGKEGMSVIHMSAQKAIMDNTTNISELEQVDFIQEELSGTCDKAIANNTEQTVKLEGNVVILKKEEDPFTIKTDSVFWDNEKRTLKAEGNVEVQWKNFSIEGKGLNVDLNNGIFEFGEIIQGEVE